MKALEIDCHLMDILLSQAAQYFIEQRRESVYYKGMTQITRKYCQSSEK